MSNERVVIQIVEWAHGKAQVVLCSDGTLWKSGAYNTWDQIYLGIPQGRSYFDAKETP